MKKKNLFIFGIIILIFLTVIAISLIVFLKKEEKINYDAINFSKEYSNQNIKIKENNSFIYKTEDEIIDIIKNKSGIIFLANNKLDKAYDIANILQFVNTNEIYYLSTNSELNKLKDIIDLKDIMVLGVKDGIILDSYSFEDTYITKEKQNELKILFDDLNIKINGDSCDIEIDHGC